MGNQASKIAGTFAVGVAVGSLVSGKFRNPTAASGGAAQEQAEQAPAPVAASNPVAATPTITVRVELLKQFTRAVFEHCGVEPEAAAEAAEVLLLADMRGIYSHGIARLHAYYEMLHAGVINAKPDVRIVHETPSTATVDGDNGLGLIVGPAANRIAMAKAEQSGSGWVTVRNTHHYGIAGYYCLQAVAQPHPMIGFSMTTASNVVTPLWGRERMLGTNPIAVAFPCAEEKPLVVDLATSVVPWGKVEEAARTGGVLPKGWAVDAEGRDATDPDAVLASGALLPLGGTREHSGHKGYCLGAMVDILCAVLSGGRWGPTVSGFMTHSAVTGGGADGNADAAAPVGACMQTGGHGQDEEGDDDAISHPGGVALGIGHFFGAMRVDSFRDEGAFKRNMDEWIRTFRGSAPVDPARPVMVPGDPEWAMEAKQARDGVPVKVSVLADLVDIQTRTGVKLPFDYSSMDLSTVKRVQATA